MMMQNRYYNHNTSNCNQNTSKNNNQNTSNRYGRLAPSCPCDHNLQGMNQKQLMDWINQCSFAVNDATLYLDTHPCDQEALSYITHFHRMRKEALAEYAAKYTPLTIDSMTDCQDKWEWVYGKWPWEGGNC